VIVKLFKRVKKWKYRYDRRNRSQSNWGECPLLLDKFRLELSSMTKREKLLTVMFTVLILALIHWIYWSYFPITENDSREWVCEEDLYKIKRGLRLEGEFLNYGGESLKVCGKSGVQIIAAKQCKDPFAKSEPPLATFDEVAGLLYIDKKEVLTKAVCEKSR
jgi:hypothetical protein